jgi:hypothetical protein
MEEPTLAAPETISSCALAGPSFLQESSMYTVFELDKYNSIIPSTNSTRNQLTRLISWRAAR